MLRLLVPFRRDEPHQRDESRRTAPAKPQGRPSVEIVGTALVALLVWSGTTLASAQDLAFSATVDKTTVDVGDPITLTITISGDLTDAQLTQPEFPDGFSVAARSQATNFSIRAGVMERSVSVHFVLVPQQPGTFQLGPFHLARRSQAFTTDPIQITVQKRPVPPNLQPQGGRFLL